MTTAEQEIQSGDRFKFGANWARFLNDLNDEKIAEATTSLQKMLRVDTLAGKTFLDAGSGSGLFSLAARKLGAHVTSYDFDPESIACTQSLKERYFTNDPNWTIYTGSALDPDFVSSLGHFDVVYSWGVLHHTGDMWRALDLIHENVSSNGQLFIALYNHQTLSSPYWKFAKKTFVKHAWTRPFFISYHLLFPVGPSMIIKKLLGRSLPRGMSVWHDLIDWLGGYPFETSTPEQIVDFYVDKGYRASKIRTVGSNHGCNEFVFEKNA